MTGLDAHLDRFVRRARLALSHPGLVVAKARSMAGLAPRTGDGATSGAGPSGPDLGVYDHYAKQAREVGLDGLVLFLSFDCDTDLDPPAALDVMQLLDRLGIKATFAVPGTQLERGAEIYRRIAAAGSEFMNHGHLPHAEWRDDQYVGITFYETMPDDVVAADIRRGHETVARVIGTPPLGFRAPHFGHYQRPDQLALVHDLARELGYRYCSTTLPAYGFVNGPAHDAGGVVELATFGSVQSPGSILDSWSHLADRRNYALSDAYGDLLIETVDALLAARLPALLTWYVDPCHVAGQAPFEKAMHHLARKGIASLSGTQAAALAAPPR